MNKTAIPIVLICSMILGFFCFVLFVVIPDAKEAKQADVIVTELPKNDRIVMLSTNQIRYKRNESFDATVILDKSTNTEYLVVVKYLNVSVTKIEKEKQ